MVLKFNIFDRIIFRLRADKVRKHIARPDIVLDYGGGDSGFLDLLGVWGDVYEKGDARVLNKEYYDKVVCLAVIEHLDNPAEALREMYEYLKPGGKLILTSPTVKAKPLLNILSLLKIISREGVLDHKRYYTKEELVGLLSGANFINIEVRLFQLGFNTIIWGYR